MMQVYRATARGKLLLFGEHAAVYGHPAIGLTLPLELCAELTVPAELSAPPEVSAAAPRGALPSPGTRSPASQPFDAPLAVSFDGLTAEDEVRLDRAIRLAGAVEPCILTVAGRIAVTSEIPRGRGLGSSAALCAAVARLLLSACVEPAPGNARLRAAAHAMEHAYHGTPSGIDTALALSDGLALLRPSPPSPPEPVGLHGGSFSLVAGCVPREGNTGSLVLSLRKRLESKERAAMEAVDGLGRISEQAAALFVASAEKPLTAGGSAAAPAGAFDLSRLAELADRAQQLLASLGLSTPILENAIDAGRRAGGLGGKLSGAGGGGAFYVLFDTQDAAAHAVQRIAEKVGGTREEATLYAITWDGSRATLLR